MATEIGARGFRRDQNREPGGSPGPKRRLRISREVESGEVKEGHHGRAR